jgi:hypothetical protein
MEQRDAREGQRAHVAVERSNDGSKVGFKGGLVERPD